jgi:hypothetical protein
VFSGLSSLKMPYNQAFNVATFTVSAWVNIAARLGTHQGIFSTRVDTGEASAGGTFDFKVNGYPYTGEASTRAYISNFNNLPDQSFRSRRPWARSGTGNVCT